MAETKKTSVKKTSPTSRKITVRKTKKVAERENRPKLLISILNPGDDEKMTQILNEYSVALSFSFAGVGTARSHVLDYLGIGEPEKIVMFSHVLESDEDIILRHIQKKMALYLVGKGISFTISLTGISQIVANGLISATAEKIVDGGKIMKDEQRKYDLIVVGVQAGYVEDVMEAARSAGAAGGTVVRSRSLGNAKSEQFIGISISQETEIILILSNRESKEGIMQAISEKAGLKTQAGGIIFSLPVDKTVGIGLSGAETDSKED